MPPLAAAAEILASPVAYTRMPQASARPTLGAVAAGPAENRPLMLVVVGAVTGPWPMAAHPLRSAAHVKASIEPFSMGGPPLTVPSPVRPDSGDSKVPAPGLPWATRRRSRMRLPLEDVTVIDLSHALAGPF